MKATDQFPLFLPGQVELQLSERITQINSFKKIKIFHESIKFVFNPILKKKIKKGVKWNKISRRNIQIWDDPIDVSNRRERPTNKRPVD
jgi:hypothetical protein